MLFKTIGLKIVDYPIVVEIFYIHKLVQEKNRLKVKLQTKITLAMAQTMTI